MILPAGSVAAGAPQAAVPTLDGTGGGARAGYWMRHNLHLLLCALFRRLVDPPRTSRRCHVREEVWGRLEGVQADGLMENRAVGLLSTFMYMLNCVGSWARVQMNSLAPSSTRNPKRDH